MSHYDIELQTGNSKLYIMKGGCAEISCFIVNPLHNAFQNSVMNYTGHYTESSVFGLFKAVERTKKKKKKITSQQC